MYFTQEIYSETQQHSPALAACVLSPWWMSAFHVSEALVLWAETNPAYRHTWLLVLYLLVVVPV